jgi:predicted metalloprotease with PDZ domain
MTTQPRKRRRPLAIALAACALATLAAACDPKTTTTVALATRSEVYDGRMITVADLSDETGIVMNGPDPRMGLTGLALSYGNPRPAGPPFADFPIVQAIAPGGVADRAGLRAGDVVLASNGADVRVSPPFPDRSPGTAYRLRVRRDNREREVDLMVGPPPTLEQVRRQQAAFVACIRRLPHWNAGDEVACPSSDPNLMPVTGS